MATVAFPFIDVQIDPSALRPVVQRSPGVIAIVGKTATGPDGGAAAVNTPSTVDDLDQAADLFAKKNADGTIAETELFNSIRLALLQNPRPSKIYGVRVDADNYAAALSALEATDDVTFVSLANEVDDGPANLRALKAHVESMSTGGQERIGVAMVNPATEKSATYVADIGTATTNLKSDSSRMIMVAARGASGDAATAAMAAIAGFPSHISLVLKTLRGISVPVASQYSPSEIKGLSEANINPIIDPALVAGESLHFAEGRCFTTDESLLHIDVVRTLDDVKFRLRAGLIGSVGDSRITSFGLTRVKSRAEGILGTLKRNGVIAAFSIDIPVLDILNVPESTRTPTDTNVVVTARANRTVDMILTITYGPAVHRLKLTLAPKF